MVSSSDTKKVRLQDKIPLPHTSDTREILFYTLLCTKQTSYGEAEEGVNIYLHTEFRRRAHRSLYKAFFIAEHNSAISQAFNDSVQFTYRTKFRKHRSSSTDLK